MTLTYTLVLIVGEKKIEGKCRWLNYTIFIVLQRMRSDMGSEEGCAAYLRKYNLDKIYFISVAVKSPARGIMGPVVRTRSTESTRISSQ